MNVSENLRKLRSEVEEHVTIVAVSKTKPVSSIQEAYDAGHRDFGENYVQELAEKQPQLPEDIRWHFIGHLQSNKIKFIAPFVHLIHGVDSFKLLKEINKQGSKFNRTINCLLQLHVAEEETKFGLSFDECEQLLSMEELTEFSNTSIRGFMSMASNTDDGEKIKSEFRSVKRFQERMLSKWGGVNILSMGMSGDYSLALQEGSNMIRVGSLIFGHR
jgi:PLP dependent protein